MAFYIELMLNKLGKLDILEYFKLGDSESC